MNENLQLNSDFAYEEYAGGSVTFGPPPIPGSVAITSINSVSGPTITLDGGTSGFSFSPAGTTITLVSPLTTKGDLLAFSTLGVRLAVGNNGEWLSADSTTATGLKWLAGVAGWGTPSSTLVRSTFATYAGQSVSVGYDPGEAQTTDDAVKAVSQRLGALITDLLAKGIIKA